ncbi:MAG: ATP-binding protein [Oscillospiraceae bacterium]|nr:ATP-binding protein [Oscillospiraceae bacterium]
MPYIILIAGIPAAGKTTYARHIGEKLRVPVIVKDDIRVKLHESLRYDASIPENGTRYGMASISVFFHIAECLMTAGACFVLESNFTTRAIQDLSPLVQKYNYRPLTVLLDADPEVAHKRFCERQGIDINTEFVFNDNAAAAYQDFCVGDKITIDTTDFAKVDYRKIDDLVIDFIEKV